MFKSVLMLGSDITHFCKKVWIVFKGIDSNTFAHM